MKERFRRRRLPHWDKPGAIYFVTSCLEGSIPALGLKDLADYRKRLNQQPQPADFGPAQWEAHKSKLCLARAEEWLDRKPAVRYLEEEQLARKVEESLLYFAGDRYAIWAWVVMASHFHWVFEPLRLWVASLERSANDRSPRERIMHSVKRHSAKECNRIQRRIGRFWQEESFDHCIDDIDELERVIDYVELNPVKANLVKRREDYRSSSASYRQQHGIPAGRPIIGTSEIGYD